MRDIKICIDTTLNSPAQVDTFDTKIMSQALIDPIFIPNSNSFPYFKEYDLKSYHRRGGEGVHDCIAIAINLTIVFADIVNFAPNNYFHTFAPPLMKSWVRP